MAYNVFLSFAMEDKSLVELFRGQAKNQRLPLEFRDYSVKEPFEHAWKTNATERIRSCSVTMCLVGRRTYQSDAVDWEIRKSIELAKGVMAVYLISGAPALPKALRERGVRPISWDMKHVMRELGRIAR